MDECTCARCGSERTRVIGWSVSPEMVYLECADCGHTTAAIGPIRFFTGNATAGHGRRNFMDMPVPPFDYGPQARLLP